MICEPCGLHFICKKVKISIILANNLRDVKPIYIYNLRLELQKEVYFQLYKQMSGTVSSGMVVINQDSLLLDEFKDVVVTTPGHGQTMKYDLTNWVNSDTFSLQELGDMRITSVSHNDVLIWNSTMNTWENGKLASLLTTLEAVVNGIVAIKLSVYIGEIGESAKALSVAFTDTLESGFTMAIGSCGDNNAIYTKGPSDITFEFLTTLNKGQNLNLNLSAGTVFRSSKGISGFSCPFPMPFGISNFSDTYFRFYALRNDNVVHATSAGRDSLVTLYASNETTIIDGPNFVSAYGSTTLYCDASGREFVVVATTDIFCGTKGDRGSGFALTNNRFVDMRLVPPMSTEVLVHSRNNRLSARFANTSVTYYRRNMTTGTFTVQAGTPLTISSATGNQANYNPDGWLLLKGEKPFTGFSGADAAGYEATPAWPLTAMAQLFPIVSTIGTSTNMARASISLASPYEGDARVYSENKVLLDTFALTRGTSPPASPDDQKFPSSGQFNPGASLGESLTSGYVECDVPCVCIMNFDGSSTFSGDAGDEIAVPGTSPDEIKAQIRKDGLGFLRRRSIDSSGVENWVLC